MSSATTLKLPADLKAGIGAATAAAGLSQHTDMIGSLASQIELAAQSQRFVDAAVAAEAEVSAKSHVYAADTAFEYLRNKLAGKPSP